MDHRRRRRDHDDRRDTHRRYEDRETERHRDRDNGLKRGRDENKSSSSSRVCKSRKLVEENMKNLEKEKAMRLCRVFEEQDNALVGEGEDDVDIKNLVGVKVVYGIDKVIDGGAVVLTIKDQDIMNDGGGGINEDVDMLENVEIGQKCNDEGVALNDSGCVGDEAKKKLELHNAVLKNKVVIDLSSSAKIASDYYTSEEMLQFRKPKKVKPLRKKEKLDLDALEGEVVSGGLSVGDHGCRKYGRKGGNVVSGGLSAGYHGSRKYGWMADYNDEQERNEAQLRSAAYRLAFAKAEKAVKNLKQDVSMMSQAEHEQNLVFGDDGEDFEKSVELSRRLALKKKDDSLVFGPCAVASLALSISPLAECQTLKSAETHERKVVFTEMEEFAYGIQLHEERPRSKGATTHDEEVFEPINQEKKDENRVFSEVSDACEAEYTVVKEALPWDARSEVVVGKGLSSTLELLRKQGDLKDTGKSVVNKKDEYRELCHKFHGKEPGKLKKEKQLKKLEQEQVKNSYLPSLSVDRMRAAQTQMKRPFLLLSGRLNPGQISDPRSGLATMINDSRRSVGSS